jgi:hypothetical protein
MAVQAAVTQYRKETVAAFRQERSLLSLTATKEFMSSGLTATFLVSGTTTNDDSVTRGQNGDIPYGSPTNTQVSATLVEYHVPKALTGFDIFASQGDQTAEMRRDSIAGINRKMDLLILAELANATQDLASGGTLDVSTIAVAKAKLGQNHVPTEEADNMFGIISPGAYGYLEQTAEFTSGDYVDMKPYNGPVRKFFRWAGINWITSSLVDGLGTSAEYLYIFHRRALGFAVNMGEETIKAGYDEMQDRSWSRATVYAAAKILQNTGIIKITHDSSAIATT